MQPFYPTLIRKISTVFFFLLLTSPLQSIAQFDVYADSLIASTSDFQVPQNAVDNNKGNYAYVSTLLGVLSSSQLHVRFPENGEAGDVVNVVVAGGNTLLTANVLNNISIVLYDSVGTQVQTLGGPSLLQLQLLSPGTGQYVIRALTNPTDNYQFREARLVLSNLLQVNLLQQFRVFGFFFQRPCEAIVANSVFAHGTSQTTALLSGYVTNPNNAVSANPNDYANMVVPLNLLNLLPPSFLDLQFPKAGRGGELVGFTVSEGTPLLSLGVLQNLTLTLYNENGIVVHTQSGFSLADVQLLNGSTDKYTLAYVTPIGNYRFIRARLTLSATVGALMNLRVYNAYHYAINRPPVTVISNRPTTDFCAGDSVKLTALDTIGVTSYFWNTGDTTRSIWVSTPGTYYVTVEDSIICQRRSIDIVVEELPNPKPKIVGDSVLCAGSFGTLVTTSTYNSYQWSTGASTDTIHVSNNGHYTVTVTDSNGCKGTDTIAVNHHNQNFNINATIINSSCSNTNNGAVNLNPTGGSGQYSYRWSTGATSKNINNLAPNIYTVTVTDTVYGCGYNRAYTVHATNTLSLQTSVVNTSGCGLSDGRVVVNVVGGSGNYSYNWSNGATGANLNNVSAGIYRLTVTDQNNGCVKRDTVAVGDANNNLNVVSTVNNAINCNISNGNISLVVTGGSGHYSYQWAHGATTANLSNLSPGNYYVIIRDTVLDCAKAMWFAVGNNGQLVINGNITPAGCNGLATGSITPVINGSGNYTYNWSTGATSAALQNISAGVYILNVTDNVTGCSGQRVFTVGEAGGPAAMLNINQPNCATNSNGSIQVVISGNQYKYFWSNNTTTKNQINLSPGIYTVTITDTVTGCSRILQATINPKSQIELIATPLPNTSLCAQGYNGVIQLMVTGGSGPYTFNWSTGDSTQNINHLGAGIYMVSVSDTNGCNNTFGIPLRDDSLRFLNSVVDNVVNASCADANDGSISVIVTGGSPPYAYLWSSGETTRDITNKLPGIYMLTVTDTTGCSKELTAEIGTNSFVLNSVVTGIRCNGDSGSIALAITNGSGNYEFNWSNGSTDDTISNLTPGVYSVAVTDLANNCTQKDTFELIEPEALSVSAQTTVDNCALPATGAVDITVSGGYAPYTFMWSNGATTEDISGLEAGDYSVRITDSNLCEQTETYTVGLEEGCNFSPIIHNAVTPNGDGHNDYFVIENIEFYPNNQVLIFDKWGDEVFSRRGYDNTWNGKRNNSDKIVPDGTYFYIIKLNEKNKSGGANEFTGYLMLQR